MRAQLTQFRKDMQTAACTCVKGRVCSSVRMSLLHSSRTKELLESVERIATAPRHPDPAHTPLRDEF